MGVHIGLLALVIFVLVPSWLHCPSSQCLLGGTDHMAGTASLAQILAIIRNAHLRYPDEELLECFLEDSIDPAATAHYVLQRCECAVANDNGLMRLLSDWKQLIASCTYAHPLESNIL